MATRLIVGLYADEDALLAATRAVREKGFAIHDAYTPFPVHGLDQAMGIPPTRLGIVCFALGMAGVVTAFSFQSWTFLRDWSLNVGGKDLWAAPALLPVTFEVGVLFAALGTVFVLFWRAGLRPGRLAPVRIPEVSDDRFALALPTPEGGVEALRALLEQHHPVEIREIEVSR